MTRHRGRADRARRRAARPTASSSAGCSRSSSTRTPTGCSVCAVDAGDGRAADDRLRRAQRRRRPDRRGRAARARCMPDGDEARQGEAARRRVRRDDPLRGRARARRRRATGSWSSTTDADAGHAARRGACRSPTPVLELEITPNRPDCLGVYGVAREVHAVTGAAAGADALGRGRRGRRARATVADYASVDGRGPRALPALHGAVFTDVTIGPVAAVAQGAADRRPASGRSTTSSTSPTT